MKTKINDFYKLISKNKKAKFFTIVIIIFVFIVTIGYSLAFFTLQNSNLVANIVVNNLSFNMTTNGGQSDDRILKLKAGTKEQFNVALTNLNKIATKYEIIYEICSDENCTGTNKELAKKINVQNDCTSNPKISGTIYPGNSKKIDSLIYTQNFGTEDIYIKIGLNAGYIWNDLKLTNQIGNGSLSMQQMKIVSFINNVQVEELPSSCAYSAKMKAFDENGEISFESSRVLCDYSTSKWSIQLNDLEKLPTTINLYFTSLNVDADSLAKSYTYDANTPYYIYTAPVTGIYKLEVWGAQGGYSSTYGTGGYGGYSAGEITLDKDEQVYVYVGSMPIHPEGGKISPGGYNGGGGSGGKASDGSVCYGGGGATHMASSEGLLSTFTYGNQESIAKILIVAGGGGGGIAHVTTLGGSGGGYIGSTGTTSISDYNNASRLPGGGTQTGAGHHDTYAPAGKFGTANISNYDVNGGGGGGGFWGGSGGRMSTGAGGSGYIGNGRLNNKKMFCYACVESTEIGTYTVNTISSNILNDKKNCADGHSANPISKCAKEGNGYAKITYVNDAN